MGLQHQFFEPDLGDQLTAVVFLVDEGFKVLP
jgi:thiazole synthase ThiGH ThiG subunit